MTDRPDFETMLERRLQAHAATGVRPVPVHEVVRSTMQAAATPVRRLGPRRPVLLVGLAAVLLLGTVAGAAMVGRLPRAIQGVFVEGPSLPAGRRVVNAITLPDGRVLAGVTADEVDDGSGALRCPSPCRPHLLTWRPGEDGFQVVAFPPVGLAVETMALLHDGRVLIVGGGDDGSPRPAWIYDPVADTYEATGTPLEARSWTVLIPLEDGRVLVAGGESEGPLASAELYDPATGRFTATGDLTRPRSIGMTATRLTDGRVLIVGGGARVGATAEIYDPTDGTFSATGDQITARGGFGSATLLQDGRVLLTGGIVPDPDAPETVPTATAAAEIYDPETGTFSEVGSMAAPRYLQAASLLPDGTVLVAGGGQTLASSGEPDVTATAEIFDPSSGTFRPTSDLLRPRLWPVAVPADGRVLVLGNLDPTGTDPSVGATSEWFQ